MGNISDPECPFDRFGPLFEPVEIAHSTLLGGTDCAAFAQSGSSPDHSRHGKVRLNGAGRPAPASDGFGWF
jgi:hypothetical protein